MLRFAPIVAAIVIAMALTATAVWLFFGAHGRIDAQIAKRQDKGYVESRTTKRQDAIHHEWQRANAAHRYIAESLAACSGIAHLADQPDSVRDAFGLDVLPDGRRLRSADDSRIGAEREAIVLEQKGFAQDPRGSAGFSLSNYAREAIYLSQEIRSSRIESANNAYVNHWIMVGFQWVIVLIGAVTTTLISLKSIMTADGTQKRWSLIIGILAIIGSSVATATSALNAFYGPREAYLKAEQSLAALRQLHSDIAVQIGGIRASQAKQDRKECPTFDPFNKEDPLNKQVQDWRGKLAAIVNTSDSGSSYPQETAVPDQPTNPAPDQ